MQQKSLVWGNTEDSPGKRAGRRRLLAMMAALLVSLLVALFALLEGGQPTQAIVKGKAVDPVGKYPFMAALLYKWDITMELNKQVLCGGTLIDQDSVLTAAHCFEGFTNADVQKLTVIVGATELGAGQGVFRDVQGFWYPTAFDINNPNRKDRKYDVAVLTLNQPVTTKDTIHLATESQNYLEGRLRTATVAGWGYTEQCPKNEKDEIDCDLQPDKNRQQKHLREAQVPLWGDKEAESVLPKTGTFTFYPDFMVTAGGLAGKGACYADSGGPLFAKDGQDHYTQIGIASFSPCGKLIAPPDTYTEVNNPSIRSFITWAASR